MGSVELSVLKTAILNAIRAAESVETAEQARKVYERYRASSQRARTLGFRISAISFGSGHELLTCEPGNSFTKATRCTQSHDSWGTGQCGPRVTGFNLPGTSCSCICGRQIHNSRWVQRPCLGAQNGRPGLRLGSASEKAHELVTEQIRKEFPDHHSRLRLQLGAEVVGLAHDLRLGMLRD